MDTAKNDIGWAIRAIKQNPGAKVRRKGWHAKDKYIWYKPSIEVYGELGEAHKRKMQELSARSGGTYKVLGTICMYLTVDGVPTLLTGWHPTPCDLLAEDWEEFDESTRTD